MSCGVGCVDYTKPRATSYQTAPRSANLIPGLHVGDVNLLPSCLASKIDGGVRDRRSRYPTPPRIYMMELHRMRLFVDGVMFQAEFLPRVFLLRTYLDD